ncbi:hypothetical protein AVM11_17015 [Sphingomonas melonis TY]|jgi:hypothetical protein|uniref:Uncharacterized protein n=2 Tax=Sphingomonadaceae TaxID=41297 RepID=A0A175Y2Z1_9SPHN|nr:hypothetical protein BJP26_07055 [Sphingomonas melonis TY]ATI54288.1 hypothetical protein CP552_00775 [Sphingomonas melonis]MBI0532147.1 hypothetical protein [Sphingomonas sp. TX0522]MCP4026735.1 hypothetical protein [Sphingomonas sp.]KZB95184.1 hypothetical protein AVM11_17015 [Sphingomonas melonis TY]
MRWYGLVLGALCAPMIATPAAARERIAMLVVQQGGPSMASDLTVRDRLAARGFTVRLADQSADPLTAREAALVVISATVSAKSVKPGWRGLAVPLVTWENDLLDDLAMTGKRHDSDFGEAEKERYLWIVNAPQPMAAGLPAGIVDVYARQAPMSWGKPGLGATIIATIYGQPEKVAIFGYETGATMDYEALAPARRVMLFMGNDGFTNLSPDGLKLFDAAIDWAIGSMKACSRYGSR